MQQIGVFGASFNPPTLGHQDVLKQALAHFDQILLVPSLSHPFGKNLVSIKHRLAMLELFICASVFEQDAYKLVISTIEETLLQHTHGPIYTYDVLTALKTQFATTQQKVQLHFIVGPDINHPNIWQKFYRYEDIEKQWPLFVVEENIPIHSTMVREVCLEYAQDDKAREMKLVSLVGEKIADYIEMHKLYRERENVYG